MCSYQLAEESAGFVAECHDHECWYEPDSLADYIELCDTTGTL